MTDVHVEQSGGPDRVVGNHRRQALWISVAAVVVVVAMGVVWLLAASRPAVDLAAAEATSTVLLADLRAAEATADVRAAAIDAQAHAAQLQEGLEQDGLDEETAALAEAHLELWRQIGGLDTLSGATLDQWEAARAGVVGAVEDWPPAAGESLAASGAAAIEALDALVADARATLQAWELERDAVLAARERNAAAAAAVQQYRGMVLAQLDLYEALRPRTTQQVQPLYDPQVSSEVVWSAHRDLRQGMEDRERVQSAVAALAVPPGLQAEHTRILLALQDAVLAMRSALDGIDEAMAVRYEWGWDPSRPIDIRATAGWQQFSAESSRLDGEVPAMRAALEQRAAALFEEYLAIVPIPRAPVV